MNHLQLLALLSSLLVGIPSMAMTGTRDIDNRDNRDEQLLQVNVNPPLVSGEIRKVDKDSGMITIKHAQIPNFDMPAMTMLFNVGDVAMLDQFKAQDKVVFSVNKRNNKLTVVHLERA